MKNSNFSLPVAIMACALLFGPTVGLAAKETGFYVHGGVTYWNGFDAPTIDDDIGLDDATIEFKLDESRAKLSLGVGFHLDEQWSFEVFYVSTPEQAVAGNNWVFPPFEPGGDSISISWSASNKQTIGGVSGIYDFYINENLSVFGKGGIAFVQHESSGPYLTLDDQPDIVLDSIVPGSITEREDTQDFFGAVGVRLPIMQGNASLTFAYQFVQTDDEAETSFEFGLQWNF